MLLLGLINLQYGDNRNHLVVQNSKVEEHTNLIVFCQSLRPTGGTSLNLALQTLGKTDLPVKSTAAVKSHI